MSSLSLMDSSAADSAEPKCAVCSVPSNKYCGNCHKVFYCSGEHQKQDRKRHKVSCFPIRVVNYPGKGRCVVATRAIKPGELILKDEELVCAPNGNVLCSLPEFRPMCLSCFKILSSRLESNYACSVCKWPLCDEDCEKDPLHANNECPIFARQKLPPFTKAVDYDHIKILRALLLSETNPEKFTQLQELESHEALRENSPNCRKKTFETVMFIRQTLGLLQFAYKIINYTVGVFRVNAFGNHNWPLVKTGSSSGFREGTFLFFWSSMFAHNCIPNTRSFLTQELASHHNNNRNDTHFWKHLLATVDIASGDEIVVSYIETRQGTVERRNILKRGYHFDCSCGRCSDPTEYGLYFSAVKCRACTSGYVLPHNSLDVKSVWSCSECRVEIFWEEIFNTVEEVQKMIEATKKEYDDNFPDNVLELEKMRDQFRGTAVHENHWLIVELEYDIIKYARNAFLECYGQSDADVPPDTLRSWKEYLTRSVQFVEQITNHCLVIAQVLRPGLSIFRGCLLFALAQCKFLAYEQVIKVGLHPNPNMELNQLKLDLLHVTEDAKQILVIEPEGSEEYRIATQMYNVILVNVKKLDQDLYFLTEK